MVHIIAEAGTNHNGSEQEAKKLINIAHLAGANSVKFQIINPWGLYLPGEYEYGHYKIKEVIKLRKKTVLPDVVYLRLNEYSRNLGLAISASVFDENGLKLLCDLSPPYVKIASCDLNNIRFLRTVAETDLKMIISTGMSSLHEINNSILEIAKVRPLDSVVLMHCVSVYPAITEETNILFLQKLRQEFGTEIGFSDHTQDNTAAIMATALGATWIEKHYTSDRTMKGLDHAYAMEKEAFVNYVKEIRKAEFALRSIENKVSDAEIYTKRRARRSLYASRNIKKGELITTEDVLCLRPEGPLNADQIDDIIGTRATADITKYAPFTFNKVE